MLNFVEWLGKYNVDNMLADLLMENLTREQFRAVWTTYCIMMDLEPDTSKYDNKLLEVYNDYWNFSVKDYEEYDYKMEANLNEDLMRGTTMIGPHKDDYIFIINNKNIGDYGSQGQQKSAILSVKLASVELVNYTKKQYPIVLLDDVFSELDKERQNQLIKILNRKAQTIITTATLADVEPSVLGLARLLELKERGE